MDSLMPATGEWQKSATDVPINGKPVVGVIGWGVPAELVEAFGATLVRIHPRHGRSTPNADALVGIGEAPDTRSLLEPVLDGSLSHCALIVVTRAHEWLYYYLKEAVRSGTGGECSIPPLHLHDFVATAEASLLPYNSQQIIRLQAALERELGERLDEAAWKTAVAMGNARRAVMRQLAELRRKGAIFGADAVRYAATSATQSAHAFVDGHEGWRPDKPGPELKARLLLLSGDDDPDGRVHEAIEAAGAIVVAEDGEWGIRTARSDPEISAEQTASLVPYMLESASGSWVSPRERRLGWAFGALEREDIDAVIFAIPASDTRFGWDYPVLRDRATTLGLPQLLLQMDARKEPAAATQAVAAFLSTTGKDAAA